jgi:hypothetical protein
MRTALFLAALVIVAGCQKPADQPAQQRSSPPETPASTAPAADDDGVDCALKGAAAFAHVCTVEQEEKGGTLFLTVRHPDGGFRRLKVTKDGRGVAAADGAAPARVTILGSGAIEVAVAGDRYRLPATVKQAR